jgi:hypothetical protein
VVTPPMTCTSLETVSLYEKGRHLTAGSYMNITMTIALYAAICKEQGLPFRWACSLLLAYGHQRMGCTWSYGTWLLRAVYQHIDDETDRSVVGSLVLRSPTMCSWK